MENPVNLVEEVRFLFETRKIRVIGISIIVGLIVIYSLGLIVASNNVNKDMAILNLISVIAAPILCISSIYLRKARLKSVNKDNFKNTFAGVYIISFFLCDLGGIFAIVTNLFINYNLVYATFGMIVAGVYVILNFPKRSDLDIINNRSKTIPV